MIFQDALPGKPLPGATNFILDYRMALVVAAVAWPVICAIAHQGRKSYAFLLINIGIICFLFEIGITIIALFMPMVGTTDGMAPGK